MKIIEHETLELKNVLSYRGKVTQQELIAKSREIELLLRDWQVEQTMRAVTTTFAVEQTASGPLVDVEILVPLDREISPPAGYTWKPHFLLTNAVVVQHKGDPSGLQNSVNDLNAYIAEHQLVPITTGYNVTMRDAKTPADIDSVEIAVYVGISPNVL